MELWHLRYFDVLCQELHFAKAAAGLREVTSVGIADDDCCQIGRRGHNDAVSVAWENDTYALAITKSAAIPQNSLSLKYLQSSFLKDIYPTLSRCS
jgi:hypothetical protein